jgi:alpha-amylase/alpha-mannosidase (GH57 family)
MHQPRYVHPVTGRPVLPWVRLHAAAGYLDMARALERHPGVRVTVNFVPSLLEQLELLLAGGRDELEELAERPADTLSEGERRSVVARSFSVRWDRAIEPRRRYAELLQKRGRGPRPDATASWSPGELRDLQCLFLLAWLGFAAREDDPAIDELDRKGRDFGEDEKRVLLAAVRRAAQAVLPAWRRLAEAGRVELSSSPLYHPIVPLIVDSDVARRSRPGDVLPPRFAWPEDARAQIRMAQEKHERVFGRRPAGMWPPEGSLSPEAVELYAACGIRWLAGDQETLSRSLYGEPAGWPPPAARVWSHAGVDLVFRDRELSDRIGFRYAELPAEEAAEDLLAGARAAGEDGVVGIFLDGENAWEGYPRRGADFLDALWGRLEQAAERGEARARTIGEAVAERGPGAKLMRLHSGSWIDASFRIWIGDPEKNRAWAQLGRARERLAAAERAGASGPGVETARRLILMAEGSDWFWWYGEPFSSAEDPIFDELFRAHLAAVWRALGDDPPRALDEPIGKGGEVLRAAPTAFVRPRMDGKAHRFFDWQGAAKHDVGRGTTMASGETPAVERAFVGFEPERLHLRLDPSRPDRRRVCSAHMRLHLAVGSHETSLHILLGAADGGPELRAAGGTLGATEVVELSLPFAAIGASPRDEVRLWFTLEFAGIPFARVPRDGTIVVVAPWPGWEDEHWSA